MYCTNNYNVGFLQHITGHTEKLHKMQSSTDLASSPPLIQSVPVGTAQRQTCLR